MPPDPPPVNELLLERKLNDELLLLCRAHGINERHFNWLTLAVVFCLGLPVVGLSYHLIEHGEFSTYRWSRAAVILALTFTVAGAGHWLMKLRRDAMNAEIRRACREATGLGYFVVKRVSQHHYQWYPYSFVLAASRTYTPEDADNISDRLAILKDYPDPYGLSGLLEGRLPPVTEPNSARQRGDAS